MNRPVSWILGGVRSLSLGFWVLLESTQFCSVFFPLDVLEDPWQWPRPTSPTWPRSGCAKPATCVCMHRRILNDPAKS